MALNTKLSITHSFFELQTPDFVWTVRTTKYKKYKSTHINSAIFWATDSRFCMEIHMDWPTKWQSTRNTKIQKYKKLKKRKNDKNAKNVECTKSTKKNLRRQQLVQKKENKVKQQKYKTEKYKNQKTQKCKKWEKYKSTKIRNSPAPAIR